MLLYRKIFFEFLRNFLLAFLILAFILLLGKSQKFVREGFDLLLLAKVITYVMPYIMTFTIPIALLTGAILTFGRMSSDNEITIIRNAGVNFWRMTIPLVIFSGIMSAYTFYLADVALPQARFNLFKLARHSALHLLNNQIQSGRQVLPFQNCTLYIGGVDVQSQRLSNLVIQQFDKKQLSREIIAHSASMPKRTDRGTVVFQLEDVQVYLSNEHAPTRGKSFTLEIHPEFGISTNSQHSKITIHKRPKDMNSKELRQWIANATSEEDIRRAEIRIYKKQTTAAACIVFLWLGVVVGVLSRHGNRMLGFGVSLGIVFIVYYPLMLGAEFVAEIPSISPLLVIWLPNIIIASGTLFLMKKVHN